MGRHGEIVFLRVAQSPLRRVSRWRGIVSTVSTSVSKTESPGSNPGTPAS
jgi:hypothetical protein